MNSVEKRLESLERNLQNLMSDFYAANNNQSKFNEEFLKAISSLSNDISSVKSVNISPSSSISPSPSLVVSPVLPLQSGIGASMISSPPQGFQLPAFSELNKKAQEDTDSEIAKRLQEEFDKQQRQAQPQPQPNLQASLQAPFAPQNLQSEPTEDCPVCGAAFPIKALPIHVETHFQQSSNPSIPPSVNPSSPPNPSQLPNSPTKQQGGFFSKIFGGKKDENVQPPQIQLSQQQQQVPQQYFQPIPGYYPGNPQMVRPGVPQQPQVYRLPPGQIPPQGSIVYRPPPPGQIPQGSMIYPPQNPPQYINPDGTIYAVPQPPK